MTEPKNPGVDAEVLAEAVRRRAKLNALSDRNLRICDVLARMIGRPVVSGGNSLPSMWNFLTGPAIAPDFDQFPQFETYRQATDALEKAKRV